ncbi:hypothetical protein JCM19000A_32790 [Silvimonas sp. JCM 19000]
MAHMLTQMRQTMVQILRDAGTAAGANVWGNRARRFNEGKLPAVHVGTLGRKSADVSDIPEFRHHVQFAVAVVVKSDETADDQAEALLQQVERALFQNPTLNGLSTIPLRPEELQVGMDGEGERVVAVYAQTWIATYDEAPFDDADVTEDATAPRFGQFQRLHGDLDSEPFESPAVHAKWLQGDYSTSKPVAQIDFNPQGTP